MIRLNALMTVILLATFFINVSYARNTTIQRWEHPRPDFVRPEWQNLNGTWKFDFDPKDIGEQEAWFETGRHKFRQQITVPFPWEAPLSGIENHEYKGVAWYEREFVVPANWRRERVWLKFGALDWLGKVWVNGQFVGKHEGGYTPFEFDVTRFVEFGKVNRLTVRAYDQTEPWQPTGKQIHWYTRTSGIWQTVYLEACPSEVRFEQIHVHPDIDAQQAKFVFMIRNTGEARSGAIVIHFENGGIPTITRAVDVNKDIIRVELDAEIQNARLWSPEDPYLYHVTVEFRSDGKLLDKVKTYFGMRKISTGRWGDHDFEYIFLNNKPYYLIGALNQAFNPEGIYTYPSDAYAKSDIEKAKQFGFNFLRLHIKIDEPRLLYWADKLGVLLMCDIPNFWADEGRAREVWEETMRAAVARDFNHPSIFAWCLFNETWGLGGREDYTPDRQAWVREMVHLAKRLDSTRLIEDNSPCFYDHVETDINSWHFYINDYERAKNHIANVVANTYPGSQFNFKDENTQATQPLINSEYGGISAGLGDQDISWCFKYLTNELRKYAKIGGYIYTELQDIEWEHNGFMDYERHDKIFGYDGVCPGFSYRDLNNPDFLIIDSEPCPKVEPGHVFSVQVYGSLFSSAQPIKGRLGWRLSGLNALGEKKDYMDGKVPASLVPYDVVLLPSVALSLPEEPVLATLEVWFEDKHGVKIARNYINIEAMPEELPRHEVLADGAHIQRFTPDSYIQAEWDSLRVADNPAGEKVAGFGVGKFEYEIELPSGLIVEQLREIELLFEASARTTSQRKVDARFGDAHWSRKKPQVDYPQTDATQWPTEVTIALNDVEVETIMLPNDPADARGVLSHKYQYDPGSYGYLRRVKVSKELIPSLKIARSNKIRITFEVKTDSKHKGGFALFGHRLGAFPVAPSVIFKMY